MESKKDKITKMLSEERGILIGNCVEKENEAKRDALLADVPEDNRAILFQHMEGHALETCFEELDESPLQEIEDLDFAEVQFLLNPNNNNNMENQEVNNLTFGE